MPRKPKTASPGRSRQPAWTVKNPSSSDPAITADKVARHLCVLRTEAGLTQRELADLVGTTASVICRLEDVGYEKHSLAMLRRIAAALGRRVEVRFVSLSDSSTRS